MVMACLEEHRQSGRMVVTLCHAVVEQFIKKRIATFFQVSWFHVSQGVVFSAAQTAVDLHPPLPFLICSGVPSFQVFLLR